ncbi:MAG: hypothetical protein OXU66_03040 [Gammaproteobacteria bacterium]|nr:hypothetical protein [Gammaproteobacteria bacterium]MDD9957892.1 hypothetical protein [Gammaproteobacteria bacterium]
MAAESNFLLIWIIYLAASAIFYWIFWVATRFDKAKWTSYSLRAVAAAVILTPWYANVQGTTMAPALMIMTLDLITMGSDAVARAAIPLILAIIGAELGASIFYLIQKRRARTKNPSENTQ